MKKIKTHILVIGSGLSGAIANDWDDIMTKEKTLRHMLKPNTWSEIEEMIYSAGFKTVEQSWRNHNFLGAIAIK